MPPLGAIGEIYIVCAAIGSIYLTAGLLLGQFHGHGNGGGHGDALGAHGHGDCGIHTHGGSLAGHAGGGVHSDGGHGHDVGHGHDAHSASETSQSSGIPRHLHNEPHIDVYPTGPHHALADHGAHSSGPVQVMHRASFNWKRFLLTILSPMTLATFLTFFGIAGIVLTTLAPFLGLVTIPFAIVVGLAITSQVLRLLQWMVFKMNVSSHVKVQDLIGHRASVLTPISSGRTGEVTYEVGATRQSAAARPYTPGREYKKGETVMIAEVKEGVIYVEPWNDLSLDPLADTVIEVKGKEKVEGD